MLSLLIQSNMYYLSFKKYKWQLHIFRYTLWSSRLSQHHRVWTNHVACTNSVAKVDIFTRSSPTLGEGGGRVTVCLFGQRQLLVHCRHNLSTFSRLCVDISCKLYSQQLVKWRRARRSNDWQLTSGEGCCCRLTGCVVTQLSDYDCVYHCLHGAALSRT